MVFGKRSLFPGLGILALLVLAGAISAQSEQDFAMGAWQALDGEPLLLVEPARLVMLEEGELSIVPIRDRREEGWVLSGPSGYRLEPVSMQGGRLLLAPEEGSEAERFAALAHIPEELQLEPLELPAPMAITPERVQEVQLEIERRLQLDQVAIKEGKPEEKERVIANNRRYLRSIVEELGWIDRERFGARTSYQATILVKHSGDLAMIRTVLPLVERDFRQDPENAQAFAILLDQSRLMLGEAQVYGSQIETDLKGNPVLAPLEEPESVDGRLAELGLPPLDDYLSVASRVLFDGKPIRKDAAVE